MLGTVFRSALRSMFGTSTEREIKKLMPYLEDVRRYEAWCVAMSNDELRAQTEVFKEKLAEAESDFSEDFENRSGAEEDFDGELREVITEMLEELLPEAFAVVCEASKRVVGMRPFDVQVMGGVVLHRGSIAEMVTGEGKTLVAVMPVYLNALTGKGVHLITVNDYLARRDHAWMGPIYSFLGLTVGLIQQNMAVAERQAGYRADVTFGTNNEFGFDYLRDNMSMRPESRVQRSLNYAIVDEIDSILIDEARTPLIISGRPEKSTDMYFKIDQIVRKLRKDKDYEIEEKGNHVILSDEGMESIERLMGIDNLYADETLGTVHMIEQALKAHHFFKCDDEYLVRNGEVMIVDEFTGRVMDGRRYSDGLHQALEAKEGVSIQFETQTVASVTYQNYFLLYGKIAGMTGTALTEAVEFHKIYGLEVVQVPTNLPLIRDDQGDLVFATEPGKFRRVVDEIIEFNKTGRPVLVGTVSIEKSELVAKMLAERGVDDFEVLNAKHHDREAAIIAAAGKRGAITIATNMAGRGTDIKLGEGVRELGGLAIVGTERHESRRIDNQLRGRCGRQGDPGTTSFYLSLEDEVARLFGGDKVKKIVDWIGGDQLDDEPLSQKMVTRSIQRAQQNVEMYNFEIRKHLKDYDDIMNKQRLVVYDTRREVLEDRDTMGRVQEMFENIVSLVVGEYAPEDVQPEEWDLDGLSSRFRQVFGFEPELAGDSDRGPQNLVDELYDQVRDAYQKREGSIADEVRDSFRQYMSGDESKLDFGKLARKRVHDLEKMALLRAVDEKWIDHLYSMDYLRESVRLRAYGQRDPLLEYKTEGFEMFRDMLDSVDENVVQTLFRLTDPEVRKARRLRASKGLLTEENDPFAQLSHYSYVAADKQQDRSFSSFDTSRFALAGQRDEAHDPREPQARQQQDRPKRRPIRRMVERVKPNDPCPCGSGKKFKKCCGSVN